MTTYEEGAARAVAAGPDEDDVFDLATGMYYARDDKYWLCMRTWPRIRAWSSPPPSRRWRYSCPEVTLHWPPSQDQFEIADDVRATSAGDRRYLFGARAYGAYVRAIPPLVRERIAPFPDYHGPLLEFAAGGPACVALLGRNPALAALLANHSIFADTTWFRTMRRVRALVETGVADSDLVAAMGATPTAALLGVLMKIRAGSLHWDGVNAVHQLLADPESPARLNALDEVTYPVLRIAACSLMGLVTDAFLRELVEMEQVQRRSGPNVFCDVDEPVEVTFRLDVFRRYLAAHWSNRGVRFDSVAGFDLALKRGGGRRRAGPQLVS